MSADSYADALKNARAQLATAEGLMQLHGGKSGALCVCMRVSPCAVYERASWVAGHFRGKVAEIEAWSPLHAPTVLLAVVKL